MTRVSTLRPVIKRAAGTGCFVYFITCEGFTKIGVAQDVSARVRTIGTSWPWPVRLEAHILGDERDEAHLHGFFRSQKLHHRNEWFRREGKLAELLEALAPYSDSFAAATAMAEHWWAANTNPMREKDRIGTRGWPPTLDEVRGLAPPVPALSFSGVGA